MLLIEKTPEPEQRPREDPLPAPPTPPVPSSSPSLTPTPKAFEELTFAEVRNLARKYHKRFDELSGDVLENLARQKHSEEMVHQARKGTSSSSSPGSHASRAFEKLTFAEVRSLAKKQYRDFDELNGDDIEGLARQGYSKALVCADNRDAWPLHFIEMSN